MREQGTDGQITCVKIYVNYSPIIPNDNVELNDSVEKLSNEGTTKIETNQ